MQSATLAARPGGSFWTLARKSTKRFAISRSLRPLRRTRPHVKRGAEWSSFDEAGRLQFQGSADNIDYFDDESARMRTFALTVFAREGTPWLATAPEGYAPPGSDQQRLQLRGGVDGHGRWPDGEELQFQTPELWVDTGAETLTTEAKVTLTSRSRNAVARGMRVVGQKQQMSLLHDVEMRYVPR